MSTPRVLAAPDSVTSGRLVTSRGTFAVLESSRGRAHGPGSAVLLLPGWTGSKEDFLAVLPLLSASGRRVVAVDQRGQYETPGPDDPSAYSLESLGLDAVALARALNAGPVHLVGHSFGGLVARSGVLERPDMFASVTLLCSGPSGLPGEQADLLRLMAEAIPANGLAAVYDAKRALERAKGLAEPPAEIENFLRRRFLANHPVSLTEITRQLVEAPDRVTELAHCGVPTLVAYGVDDDGWSVDVQRAMGEHLRARQAAIPGAGHSPAVEQPVATAQALTAFWAVVAGEVPQLAGRRAP